jgi:preprotein translocase subunit YajC
MGNNMLITLIQQAAPSAGGSIMNSLLLFGPLILIFYFLILRPQSQQAKKHKAMLSELQRNDEVVTRGGIIGKIKKVGDEELTITSGTSEFKIARAMVAAKHDRTAANDAG